MQKFLALIMNGIYLQRQIMFGRKTRELKRIRKELRGIRTVQSTNNPESSTGCLRIFFIFLIVLVIYAIYQISFSSEANSKLETKTSVISEKNEFNITDSTKIPETVFSEKIEDTVVPKNKASNSKISEKTEDNVLTDKERYKAIIAEYLNKNIEDEPTTPTITKPVEKTKKEINLDVMKGSSLDPVQKLSLANALEGFGTTLKSVEKIGDWNLGERYRILVGWYEYIVYFNKQKVQSINNLSNELVYGSRPNY